MLKRDRYDVPEVPLPAQYKNAPEAVSAAPDSKKSPQAETRLDPVLVEWWHVFGSAELDDLINRGLANNPDVRIATFKIVQAKARSDQAVAGKGPTVTAPMQVMEQYPYYGVGGPATNRFNPNPALGPNNEKVRQLFQASIQGSWRMDLWGELDALAQSSNLQLWRASFERDNAQGNVAANIASNYVEYLSLNDRLRVARETEAALSGMLASVEERVEGGEATVIDLEQQRSAVYAVRATIPLLEQQREDALGNLAFLLGTVPSSLSLSDGGLDTLALPSVIPGVPASLLLRRPDVRMVEARLLAADADIDVARARILPPLDLTAQVGYGSAYMADLFKPQALFWSTMANLSATIFDGGKLSREKEYAQAVHEEMVETYVRTIYQAVREVESALNAIKQTEMRLRAQKEATDAAHRAWDFSSEVYAAGAIDYLALLDAERTYQQKLDDFHRIRMDRYRALVNLFHAMGGGVPQSEALPGKGARPVMPAGKGGVILAAPNEVLAIEGAEWADSQSYEKEDAWLVELPGLYHRKTIDAAWLDLKTRFPALMENLSLRRYQKDRIEESVDKKLSWYQLYLAKFPTAAAAAELCAALQAKNQRCRVVFSRGGSIVAPDTVALRMDGVLVPSSKAGGGLDAVPLLPAVPDGNAPFGQLTLANEMAAPADRKKEEAELKDAPADAKPEQSAAQAPQARAMEPEQPAHGAPVTGLPVMESPAAEAPLVAPRAETAATEAPNAGAAVAAEEAAVGRPSEETPRVMAAVPESSHLNAPVAEVTEATTSSGEAVLAETHHADAAHTEMPSGESGVPAISSPPASSVPGAGLSSSELEREQAGARMVYVVQLAVYRHASKAVKEAALWQAKGYEAYVRQYRRGSGRNWYKILAGAFSRQQDAKALASSVEQKEGGRTMVCLIAADQDGRPGKIIDVHQRQGE